MSLSKKYDALMYEPLRKNIENLIEYCLISLSKKEITALNTDFHMQISSIKKNAVDFSKKLIFASEKSSEIIRSILHEHDQKLSNTKRNYVLAIINLHYFNFKLRFLLYAITKQLDDVTRIFDQYIKNVMHHRE